MSKHNFFSILEEGINNLAVDEATKNKLFNNINTLNQKEQKTSLIVADDTDYGKNSDINTLVKTEMVQEGMGIDPDFMETLSVNLTIRYSKKAAF